MSRYSAEEVRPLIGKIAIVRDTDQVSAGKLYTSHDLYTKHQLYYGGVPEAGIYPFGVIDEIAPTGGYVIRVSDTQDEVIFDIPLGSPIGLLLTITKPD